MAACTVAASTVAVELWTASGSTEPLGDRIDLALQVLETGFGEALRSGSTGR